MGGMYDRSNTMPSIDEQDERLRTNTFVDRGDLSIWEFLTNTYDHELLFENFDDAERSTRSHLPVDINNQLSTKRLQAHTSAAEPNSFPYQPLQCSSMQQPLLHHEQQVCNVQQHSDTSNIESFPEVSEQMIQPIPSFSFSKDTSQQSFGPVDIAMPRHPSGSLTWTSPLHQPLKQETSNPLLVHNPAPVKNYTAQEIPDISYQLFIPQNLVPPFQQQNNEKLLLKPLSPYNYYFRDESDNIVRHLMENDGSLPPPVSDLTQERMQALLFQHWFLDPIKKRRRHRKTHGRISFETLARVIAERWDSITPAVRSFYQMVAQLDKKYYQDQLEEIARQKEAFSSISE